LVLLAAPAPAADRIEMDIIRNDEHIGTHSIDFVREGDRLHVDTKVEVAVKMAFVTVYRMLKTSRETWKEGRVVAYDATVDDNGTVSKIRVRPNGENLVVEGPAGRVTAPLGTMISGYWSDRTVKQKLLVDSSDGVLRRVTVGEPSEETLAAGGRKLEVRRYRMTGDLVRDLWYGPDGRLVKMRETASDGSVIVTELTAFSRKE
jgi:hypothetical protein